MAEEQQAKQFIIQKIYLKDVSFETPNSPVIFTQKWEPKVDFNLSSNAQALENGLFEVSLTVTITVKLDDKTAYLAEATQAGVFTITGFEEQEMGPMIGSYCPTILFPFAREAVSDLVTKGGFPPMLLAPVNFDALYMQHVQQQQNAAPGSTSLN
ncbi:MAG: protein-export chaperone SecB [Candidatus Methylumidiphilus sp.]